MWPNPRKKSQAAPYAEQYHAVLIVRGSCGSALLVEPMFSENILATAAVYVDKFTVEQMTKHLGLENFLLGLTKKIWDSN